MSSAAPVVDTVDSFFVSLPEVSLRKSFPTAFVTLLALSPVPLPVAASESVTAELARTGAITCRPTLKHFCRNIHVGCSGRSSIATFTFVVTMQDGQARVRAAPVAGEVRSGPIEWTDDYAIVWLRPTPDYIKVTADGSYSFRHYANGTAYMSYGNCR